MKSLKLRISFVLLFLIGSTVSLLGQAVEPKMDRLSFQGSFVDGKYSNNFFGFELDLPRGWISLSPDEVQTATDLTAESLRSGNSTANEAIEKAYSRDTPLFLLGKNPLGAIENASIGMNAVKQPSQYITAKMVIESTKSAYLKNPNTKLVEDTKAEVIGGKTFLSIEFDLQILGQRMPLKLYVVVLKGYSLTVSISSLDSEIKKQLEASLRTLRFSAK